MTIWWEITYFDNNSAYHSFNNSMVPFKLLPHLKNLSIKNGHLFDTDEFQIQIPGADLSLHMPTKSLWVDGKPYYIPDAVRVVLYEKNIHQSDGQSWKIAHLGLVDAEGNGTMAKFNLETHELVVKNIIGNIPDNIVDLQEPILIRNEI